MMKQTLSLLAFCCSLTVAAAAELRDTVSLNSGWLFSRDSLFRDAVPVDLPHDFLIAQPWMIPAADERADNSNAASNTRSRLSARGFKEMGCGWYKKRLAVSGERLANRRVLLDFGGIMLVGDVWLNGEHVGKTDYGYVGFEVDITKKMKAGQDNMLLVKADTRRENNSRWYTGGGLFRDVRLITTPQDKYFARHPLSITTQDNKTVRIKAEVYCYDKQATTLHFRTRILDAEGRVVAERQSRPAYYRRQRLAEYELEPIELPQPKLWSTDTPYLYRAEVTLLDEQGNSIDQVTERFGVRTVEFSPDSGLKVNGQKVLLKGIANHHTLGTLGAAAYPRAIEKRLRMLKDFGFNHVRCSHNPYSDDFYRLCDELGLLVVDELYDKWTTQYAGGRTDWQSLWQHDIPEWVKSHRNHPSVILWSLGNELQQMPNLPFNDWGVTCYRLLRELVCRYDSSRLTTVAMHPRYRDLATDSIPAPLARATDIAAYNYRYRYFAGDRQRYPHMMFYQSEASVSDMPQNFFGMNHDWVIGLAYWGAIDYLGESKGWPNKGWTEGIFDISLQPKPLAWLARSMFKPDEPVVHIGIVERQASDSEWNGVKTDVPPMSDHWNRRAGERLTVYTYTNADEVELLANGRSLGRQRNDRASEKRNSIVWKNVEYQPGKIEAIARTGGKIVARHRIETAGEVAALRLEADDIAWQADGQDLQHIRITAVDKQGRRVPVSDDVSITVEGDARLVAVSNGDLTSEETASQQHIRLYQGTALAILRSGTQPGTVTVTARTETKKLAAFATLSERATSN